jgi:hypothetical protein
MFWNTPGEPTRIKHIAYLAASIILGLLLSLIAHAFIEMNYLGRMGQSGQTVTFYGGCALPPIIQAVIWLAGGIGGYFLGQWWWRKLYVERVWARKR